VNTPPDSNERQIAHRLQAVLVPLDRQIDWGNTLLAAALVFAVPGTFLGLWLLTDTGAKRALGWSAGTFALVMVLGLLWDTLIARLALWRFDTAFPRTDPLRGWAMVYLNEVELATKAEERLRELLLRFNPPPPRRLAPPMATFRLDGDAVPAIEPTPPQQVGVGTVWMGPRPGSAYDFIPLEPRSPQANR
jgi:hypothetical protein